MEVIASGKVELARAQREWDEVREGRADAAWG
jgi:hypothetical protein